MNIEELIRWLEAFEVDGHYGTWVPDEIREAAQALREQQAEIKAYKATIKACNESCGEWADANERLEAEIERLRGCIRGAYEAGYEKAHDDTVEGNYSPEQSADDYMQSLQA